MIRITVLLIFISSITYAQKSVLYNKHRQLIVDTSFHVDEHTYKNLPRIEKEVLSEIYDNLQFRAFRLDLPQSGMVIVKIAFNKGVCTFEVVRSKVSSFETAVYNACKIMKKDYSRLWQKRDEDYLLYVPVKFEMIPTEYNRLLKKNHAITIKREHFLEHGFADTEFTHSTDLIITPKLEKKP